MSGSNSAPNGDWIRLNVGGKVFQTTKNTLSRYPGSFLSRLVNGELPSEKDESGAYLIDGNPEHFDTILTYLRRGVVNLDGNEKTTKDLLCEADFYNIEPLVDLIRKAMSPANNRQEMVIVSRESSCVKRSRGSRTPNFVGYLLVSERAEDYEVLQALRQKIDLQSHYFREHSKHYISSPDTFDTWKNIELTLRSFGFVQESNDSMYGVTSYGSEARHSKSWKFVRTVRE